MVVVVGVVAVVVVVVAVVVLIVAVVVVLCVCVSHPGQRVSPHHFHTGRGAVVLSAVTA